MRPPRYGKGGLTRYAAMMADKLKTPGLSAAEQARIQRAVDQGFTNIAYHSTHEPWDEIDLNYTDIGLHAGTPTQAANRALDKAIQAKLQKHRSEGKYIPHTNVMPFAYRPGKSLRVTDVGEFKDAMTTLLGLRSNPELKGQAWIDDLLDYVEPEKMSYTPQGQEADWLTDTANLMALADIRQNLRGMGYDTVVYPNQIENAYEAQTELLPEAEARLAAIKQAADALYQKGRSLSPAVPDLNATEEDIAKFLAAGDPLDYLSPDERALYEKYRDESYGVRQDPANYDNPNSVIFLDPSGVRSVNAQFAPEAIGETGLFKRDGGPVAFGRGGINRIAEQAAEGALDMSQAAKVQRAAEAVKKWDLAGRPRMESMDSPAKDARSKLIEAFEGIENPAPNVFWRGTNNTTEPEIAGSINSKNHVTGQFEGGLSVSKSPATIWSYGYKSGYRVTGDVAGYGSDGEPVLKNVKVVDSKVIPRSKILEMDKARLAQIRDAYSNLQRETGVPVDLIQWLKYY